MNHTALSRTGPAFLGAVLAAACGASATDGDERPELVLFVMIDTLRADHLPFHGYEKETAPFLTELAARSAVFERAWSPSSWTPPAAASVFTGVYPIQHGVWDGLGTQRAAQREGGDLPREIPVDGIPADLQTLPELMSSLGYRCFGIADNPHMCAAVGFERGFHRFRNFDYAGAEVVNGVLAEWRAEIADARPAFVYLHYMDPHMPYHRREPWFQPEADASAMEIRRTAYDSEIRYLDDFLRQAFELLGVDAETLVVLTADHGEEFGDHGGTSHKFQLYDELTRVPFLVSGPGVTAGRIGANVSTVDVLPTLRELLGAPSHSQDAGESLAPGLLGEPLPERTILSMRSTHEANMQAVIDGDRKYIRTRSVGGGMQVQELYELEEDPGEQRNLARERTDVTAGMDAELRAFLQSAPRWEPRRTSVLLDAEQLKQLDQLGYGGDDGE